MSSTYEARANARWLALPIILGILVCGMIPGSGPFSRRDGGTQQDIDFLTRKLDRAREIEAGARPTKHEITFSTGETVEELEESLRIAKETNKSRLTCGEIAAITALGGVLVVGLVVYVRRRWPDEPDESEALG